MFGTNR